MISLQSLVKQPRNEFNFTSALRMSAVLFSHKRPENLNVEMSLIKIYICI